MQKFCTFVLVLLVATCVAFNPQQHRNFFGKDYDVGDGEIERLSDIYPTIKVTLHVGDGKNDGSRDLLQLNIIDIYGKTTGDAPLFGHGELLPSSKYEFEVRPERVIGPPASASLRIVGRDAITVTIMEVEIVRDFPLQCVFRTDEDLERSIDEYGTGHCHFESPDLKDWEVRVKTAGSPGWAGTSDLVMIDLLDQEERHSGWISLETRGTEFGRNDLTSFPVKIARSFTEKLSRVIVWKLDEDDGIPGSGTDAWKLQYIQVQNTAGFSQYFPFEVEVNNTHYCYSMQPDLPRAHPVAEQWEVLNTTTPRPIMQSISRGLLTG